MWGGACIPVYPHFLIEVAEKMKINSDITKLARQSNLQMPQYCVGEALELLHSSVKSISGANVAVLGLAFRGGVSDTRLSPTYHVIEEFMKSGCRIVLHDPYVSKDDNIPSSVMLTSKLEHALKDADLVFIATDHPQYAKLNEKVIAKLSSKDAVIYDGRGVLDPTRFGRMRFSKIGRKGI